MENAFDDLIVKKFGSLWVLIDDCYAMPKTQHRVLVPHILKGNGQQVTRAGWAFKTWAEAMENAVWLFNRTHRTLASVDVKIEKRRRLARAKASSKNRP